MKLADFAESARALNRSAQAGRRARLERYA